MDSLDAQQKHLASSDFDLRITNLARFIHCQISASPGILDHPSANGPDDKIKLLDVGAGNGLLLKFFLSQGFEVAGLELSSDLVEKMKTDPKLQSVSVSQADITQLKGQSQYDVVICNDVIEHIQDDELALKNLWSFVKKGGLLVISVPAHSFLYGKRDKAWGHFRRYDKNSLKSKVESLNASQIQFITYWNFVGFFVYFLFEKVLQKPINEELRYSSSPLSQVVRRTLDKILQVEKNIGGVPLGLTLVMAIRKS